MYNITIGTYDVFLIMFQRFVHAHNDIDGLHVSCPLSSDVDWLQDLPPHTEDDS